MTNLQTILFTVAMPILAMMYSKLKNFIKQGIGKADPALEESSLEKLRFSLKNKQKCAHCDPENKIVTGTFEMRAKLDGFSKVQL